MGLISCSHPFLKSGEYPSQFESLDRSTYNIFHDGRQRLCNSSAHSFSEERTLFPFGNCDEDGSIWKNAFDEKTTTLGGNGEEFALCNA